MEFGLSPYSVVVGDLLSMDVDAIVVPIVKRSYVRCEFIERLSRIRHFSDMMRDYNEIYNAQELNFWDCQDSNHYDGINHLLDFIELDSIASITLTSGYDLKAKYVFHVYFPIDGWSGSQSDDSRYQKQFSIYKSYLDVLDCAEQLHVKSIAFPVFGTCYLEFPLDYARLIAECAVGDWYNQHKDSDIITKIVIPPTPKAEFSLVPKRAEHDDFVHQYKKIFDDYAEKFDMLVKKSGLERRKYRESRALEYLNSVKNKSDFCNLIKVRSEVFTHFFNAILGLYDFKPGKKRVVTFAIAMELPDYERYEFIHCCRDHCTYPEDEFDETVETIIRSGISSFGLINKYLCEIDPEYDLTAPLKKTQNKPKDKIK